MLGENSRDGQCAGRGIDCGLVKMAGASRKLMSSTVRRVGNRLRVGEKWPLKFLSLEYVIHGKLDLPRGLGWQRPEAIEPVSARGDGFPFT